PFALTAAGSDPNGDTLTYDWEERDLGAATTLAAADNGASPLFRSFNPTASPTRTFPKLSSLINNTTSLGESLPTTNRALNFHVSVRDSHAGGGGVNRADARLTVVDSGAAFAEPAPNTAVSWAAGTARTVTWNVSGTAAAPISAAFVNIRLSTDGGNTFPT